HLSVARRRHRPTGNPAAREDDRLSALSLAGMAAAVPSLRSARNYGSRSDLRIGALSALADRGDGAERGTSMKPPCGVITLTTDFGVQDSYVGTMKGVILGIHPQARIIDITHQVTPQDTLEASLILENAYPYFPPGTVHVAVVDPGVGSSRRPIVVVTPDHLFVGPDNGTFTRIFEAHEIEGVFEITNDSFMLANVSHTFHGRDVFAPAAAHLASGRTPEEVGPRVTDPRQSEIPVPRIYP